jgi:hypothetical protein
MDKVKQAFTNFPQAKAVWYDEPNDMVYLSYNARPKLRKVTRAEAAAYRKQSTTVTKQKK